MKPRLLLKGIWNLCSLVIEILSNFPSYMSDASSNKVWNFTTSEGSRVNSSVYHLCSLGPCVVWIRVPVVRLKGEACLPWSKLVPCVENSFNRVLGRNNTAERSHHRLSAGGVRGICASRWSESHTFTFQSNWILPQSPPEEINHSWVLTPSALFPYLHLTSRALSDTFVKAPSVPFNPCFAENFDFLSVIVWLNNLKQNSIVWHDFRNKLNQRLKLYLFFFFGN